MRRIGPTISIPRVALGMALGMALACATAWAGTENVAGGKEIGGIVWFQNLSGTLSGHTGGGSATAVMSGAGSTAPGFVLTLKTIGSLALDFSYTPIAVDTAIHSNPT